MNKLVTHYRNSTQLRKEDLTKAEKEEIISTLNLIKKCETLEPEEQEEEFMTMCFNYGLDDDQTRAAKEIFLGIEPSEVWERNILALERGEWVDSMQTKCFKRWNKTRPSLLTTLEFIFKCKIPEVIKEEPKSPKETKLKDSMEDKNKEVPADGIVGQIAKWINEEVDEAEAEIRHSGEHSREKRERAKSTPILNKRNSPPPFSAIPSLSLSQHTPLEDDNDPKKKKEKGKKKESSRTKSSAEIGISPPNTPRKSQELPSSPRKSHQEEETERKAEIKRRKSKRHTDREASKLHEDKEKDAEHSSVDKRRLGWVRKLSVGDLGKKKESGKESWRRRGSVDSLTGVTLTVSMSDLLVKEEDKKRSESDTELRGKRSKELERRDKDEGRKESDGKHLKESGKVDKRERDNKKDKKPPLICWMGSSEDLRAIDENTLPSDFSRAMLTRSRDSPTEEKRREIETLAKAKTIQVYQSFRT